MNVGSIACRAAIDGFGASGVSIDWDRHLAGVLAVERGGVPLPIELLDSIRRNKVALKGPVTTPIAAGFTSVNVGLRKALDRLRAIQEQFGGLYRGVVVAEREQAIAQRDALRDAFEHSTSWRATAPLRWIRLKAARLEA